MSIKPHSPARSSPRKPACGLRPSRIWAHLFEAYGFSTQGFDVYLAEGLAEGEPDREASEQDMIHRAFTDQEIARMIRSGQIVDAPSLAALTLFQLQLSSGNSPAS